MNYPRSYFGLLIGLLIMGSCQPSPSSEREETTSLAERWSEERIWAWYDSLPWLSGTNFNPSTAINQLEFWQEATFDPETIDRELGWSAQLGFNLHRVYLHNLLWDQDSTGFLQRLDQFLSLAHAHDIGIMLVLLDDVWHPLPQLGTQPDPVPHLHNSGWVQAPGAEILGDSSRHGELEGYIKGVLSRFAEDSRVICWDLYNEPDNRAQQPGRKELEVQDKHIYSLALLKKVFKWAREVDPSQPLSVGIWRGTIDHWGTPDSLPELDRFMMEHSDFVNFHAYDGYENVVRKIEELKKYQRPMICTEYLARGNENKFQNVMTLFKEENIGAINWGFVSGKTQTIYPWSSWSEPFTAEPEIWHHDILRADGSPYDPEEITIIKQLNEKD